MGHIILSEEFFYEKKAELTEKMEERREGCCVKKDRKGNDTYYSIEDGRMHRIDLETYNNIKKDAEIHKLDKAELENIIEEEQMFEKMCVKDKKVRNIRLEKGKIYACRIKPVKNEKKSEAEDEDSEEHSYDTARGDLVRSKSEVFIADALFKYGIPYEYEKLMYGYYPDFFIEHNVTGKPVIWEHFGLMSDPIYVQKCLKKINVYGDHGFNIGENFIISFEYLCNDKRSNIVFGPSNVEKLIRKYLLP